eukprot:455310-Rhodomonas_salina.1
MFHYHQHRVPQATLSPSREERRGRGGAGVEGDGERGRRRETETETETETIHTPSKHIPHTSGISTYGSILLRRLYITCVRNWYYHARGQYRAWHRIIHYLSTGHGIGRA